MIRKYLIIALFTCLFSLPAFGADKHVNIYEIPREMPAREIIGENGNEFKISDFNGDFVMIVMWSRYCAPCLKELDNLNKFVKKTRNNGIRVVMLSPESEWKSMTEQRNFLNNFNAPDLEIYVDHDKKLAEDLGVFTSPHTVLVNTKGEEIGRIRGSAEWDKDAVIEYIYKIKAENG